MSVPRQSIGGFIVPNKNFQASINISFDLGDYSKIEDLIPTSTVCKYTQWILEDVLSRSSNRAKMLVGAYGKGKSHIALAVLTAMSMKDPKPFARLIEAYEKWDPIFAEEFKQFVTEGPRLLPVVVSGSASDIARSLLYALRNALKDAGVADVMPRTNYSGALDSVRRWRSDYPDTYHRMEKEIGMSGETIEAALKDFDTVVYARFLEVYPMLTSGSTFDTLADANVIETYEQVLDKLQHYGYSGIFVVYDEFSKYLESTIASATIEDIKLLQDFAERCNSSAQRRDLHMLLISHKNLANYIDANLPKEKVDGWRGVSGRFNELEIYDDSDQAYELIFNAINKDDKKWSDYLESHAARLERVKTHFVHQHLFEDSQAECVVFGCFPLHPTTTFLLPRVSEMVAQNERTMFTFLSAEEQNSLPQRSATGTIVGEFVTPDYIYDYFEPQLRRERYGSAPHTAYALVRSALANLEEESLEARMVKTIALIRLVEQYNRLSPTKDTIVRIFQDAGWSNAEIESSFDRLVNVEGVAYLNRSNTQIRLKETSGLNVSEVVDDEANRLRGQISVAQILTAYQSGKALYPSRHNEEKKITRYFDCRFESASRAIDRLEGDEEFPYTGDGSVVAVIPRSAEEVRCVITSIRAKGNEHPTIVFAVPTKGLQDIEEIAYRYAAAEKLHEAAIADEVLRDEFEIVLEDSAESLSSFVADYFRPERRHVSFFVGGHQKYKITHRKGLSNLLSDVCDEVYYLTPVINNEMINKDEPTGTTLTSRAKILTALCAKNLEANLGFLGNGQESSIMRSVLGVTGVVTDLEGRPMVNLKGEHSLRSATDTIEEFFSTENEKGFNVLYDRLTLPQYHIGMKRGPIPILIALVLRNHRETAVIVRDGEEQPIDKSTLEDIDSSPASFVLKIVDWNEGKAAYVNALGRVFGKENGDCDRAEVADLARSWFVSLPQFSRMARIDYANDSESPFGAQHRDFFKAIGQASQNPRKFLFEALPAAFGRESASLELVSLVDKEKQHSDGFIGDALRALERRVQYKIAPSAPPKESLASSVAEWLDSLSPEAKNHVFSGVGDRIMTALSDFTYDVDTSMKRLAKAVVSLRIEDWDDSLFTRFVESFNSFVDEVETFEASHDEMTSGGQSIVFYDASGNEEVRSFDPIECSPRAKLLKNQIVSAIEDMGQSITQDEKRQVVFEVLRSMC